jgi:hypothetical protein
VLLIHHFLKKVQLLKGDADEAETKMINDCGFMRAVGMILWAVRHVFTEGKYGVSQLCSVMSSGSNKSFKAAMHMIAYMLQRSERGIRFNANGNTIPFGMFDASNKLHPENSCAHAGYCVMWMGGPVASWSKRLRHIGHSSEHNEFMCMAALTKWLIWMRQMLAEINFTEQLAKPTLMFGDNVNANKLCKEHFVSTGNQYIYSTYHLSREARDLGFVDVKWVKSEMNISDLFTKALSHQKLNNEDVGLLKYLLGYADMNQYRIFLESILDIDANKAMQ